MTLAYFLRLVCLCLACLGMVQVIAGLAVAALANRAISVASRLPAVSAAGLLLALRLLPAGAGLFATLGLCLPSYLWLEEDSAAEPVGWLCLAAATLGASFLAAGLIRAARAVVRSPHIRSTLKIQIDAEDCCVVDSTQPVFALTGVFRSRLLLSSSVLQTLSANELSVALSHEIAHRKSRDNMKRLLLRLTPVPVSALDRAWSKFAEWAADDAAVSGDPDRSLALASALVRFARLTAPGAAYPLGSCLLGTCLLEHEFDLTTRVERLLAAPVPAPKGSSRILWVVVAAGSIAVLVNPASLAVVHNLLESLIH